MLEKVTADQFQKIVGTEVEVTVMDGPNLTLTLTEVTTSDPKCDCMPEGCRKQPFTLRLSGGKSYQIPDGTYDLSFEQIGLVTGVFVDNKADIPKQPEQEGGKAAEADDHVLYEVVFS